MQKQWRKKWQATQSWDFVEAEKEIEEKKVKKELAEGEFLTEDSGLLKWWFYLCFIGTLTADVLLIFDLFVC